VITRDEIKQRQEHLRDVMTKEGIDALCVGASAQIDTRGLLRYLIDYYLPVFEEYLVIPRQGPVVFFPHDGCGADHARAFGVVDEVRPIPDREYATDPAKSIVSFLKEIACKTVGTAWGRGISSGFCISFRSHIEDIKDRDFSTVLERMRMIKSPSEIKLIKEAVRLNETVLDRYLKNIAVGRIDMEAVCDASQYALQNGAEDLYWMTSSSEIPAIGFLATSRRRHHILNRGEYHYVVLEHSCSGGYFSEITQLISLGKPKNGYIEALNAVTAAQKEAAAAIRPGIQVSRIADIAHKVLTDYGYRDEDASLSPCIGHSQGLDAWEPPQISGDEKMTVKPGMRFNLHPVVVLPDGAKITSCISYMSTEDEAELLSSLPAEIIVV